MLNIDTRIRARVTLLALVLIIIAAGISLLFSLTARSREERALRGSSTSQLLSFLKKNPENARGFYYLGVRLRDEGKLKSAWVAFRQATRLDPDSEDILLAFVNTSLAAEDQQDAFDALKAFVQKHPKSGQAHLSLAAIYQSNMGDIAAYREATAAVKYLPNDSVAWRILGAVALQSYRESESETDFRKSLALNPNDWRTEYGLGNSLHKLQRDREAVSHYQRALTLNPNQGVVVDALGHALLELASTPAELQEASQTLERSAALEPSSPSVRMALGESLMRQKRWREAKDALVFTEHALPDSPEVHFKLIRVYQQLKDAAGEAREEQLHRSAQFYATTSTELESRCGHEGHVLSDCLKLARFYVSYHKFDKAISQYQDILRQVPGLKSAQAELAALNGKISHSTGTDTSSTPPTNTTDPLITQADNLLILHNYTDAERAYRQILAVNPRSPLALQGLATALYAQGKRDAAFDAANRAVGIDRTLPKAQFTLAQIYYKAGLEDEAARRLAALVAQVPDNAEYAHALGSCYIAHSLTYAQAEEYFNRAVQLSPKDGAYICDLAIAQALRQKLTDAERNFRLSAQLEPDNPAILSHFGSFLADHAPTPAAAAEAEQLLTRSLAAIPNDTGALASMGRLCVLRGDDKSAIKFFEQTVSLAPSKGDIWYELGREYRKIGNAKRADLCMAKFDAASKADATLPALEEQARQHLQNPDLRLKLARLYARDGQNAKAIDQYQNYLRLHGAAPGVEKELTAFENHLKSTHQMPDMSTFNLMVNQAFLGKHG